MLEINSTEKRTTGFTVTSNLQYENSETGEARDFDPFFLKGYLYTLYLSAFECEHKDDKIAFLGKIGFPKKQPSQEEYNKAYEQYEKGQNYAYALMQKLKEMMAETSPVFYEYKGEHYCERWTPGVAKMVIKDGTLIIETAWRGRGGYREYAPLKSIRRVNHAIDETLDFVRGSNNSAKETLDFLSSN